jgi:phosphohistidine phosphatase
MLYRHADAVRPPGTADVDRDLSPRGEREARAAADWLAAEALVPDLVVVSPSVRTRRTWALTATALAEAAPADADPARDSGGTPPVVVEPAVYRAGTDELLEVVRDLPPDVSTALICGHEPGLSEVLVHLAGEDSDGRALRAVAARGMRKGSVAVLVADDADDLAGWRHAGAGSFRLVRVSPPG